MKKFILLISIVVFNSCTKKNEDFKRDVNLEIAQKFLDNIILQPKIAKSLLHDKFTFSWMGNTEQGGKIWNKDNLFDEYFKTIIPQILPPRKKVQHNSKLTPYLEQL